MARADKAEGDLKRAEGERDALKSACFDKYGSGGVFIEVEHLKADNARLRRDCGALAAVLQNLQARLPEILQKVEAAQSGAAGIDGEIVSRGLSIARAALAGEKP